MVNTADPANETERTLLRIANGLRLTTQSTPAPVALGRRQAVGFRGKARLYYYPPNAEQDVLRTPLVLFPYLGISRPYIFDLRPGESFAEYLSANGVPLYLCDWGVFGPEDRDMDMDTVIGDVIPALMRRAAEHARADQVTAFGYCMGVPMTAAALAHDRSLPAKNLLAMVGPIDFSVGDFPRMTDEELFDVDAMVETFDLMPAEFIKAGFKMLNPAGDLQMQVNLMDNLWNTKWLQGFQAMNRWSNEWVPLPKQFFRQWVRHFYQRNELIQGEFRVQGAKVDLSHITQPLLCVGAAGDDIVPAQSASALIDAVSSNDKHFMELPGGHISVIAGRRARQEVWPTVVEWLRERDG
ncbi:MAG: hypothetical protein U5Q44_14355 [Dehalococcoidia bacterium]|nr:hypothetical protein [Dehalococcoidia bacterium]